MRSILVIFVGLVSFQCKADCSRIAIDIDRLAGEVVAMRLGIDGFNARANAILTRCPAQSANEAGYIGTIFSLVALVQHIHEREAAQAPATNGITCLDLGGGITTCNPN